MEGLRGGECNLDGPCCEVDAAITKCCRMSDLVTLDRQVLVPDFVFHFAKGHGAYTSLIVIRCNNEQKVSCRLSFCLLMCTFLYIEIVHLLLKFLFFDSASCCAWNQIQSFRHQSQPLFFNVKTTLHVSAYMQAIIRCKSLVNLCWNTWWLPACRPKHVVWYYKVILTLKISGCDWWLNDWICC
jgi:hypothetical protein